MARPSGGESTPAAPKEDRREWAELPRELTASIVSRLAATEILRSAQFVCKSWKEACENPLVWRRINMYSIAEPAAPVDLALDHLCRRAVDRSRGQLLGIGISYFGNDYLLGYITQRYSSNFDLPLIDYFLARSPEFFSILRFSADFYRSFQIGPLNCNLWFMPC